MKLFIDDIRNAPADFLIARTSQEAIDMVKALGIPNFISFDHDLGGNDTAMVFVNWLIDYMLDNDKKFPEDFSFTVHSANPVGKLNIENKMKNFVQFLKNN